MSDETLEDVQIVPIAEELIEGYHRCLDSVARERRYLAFVEAPPLESTREFVQSNTANDVPQSVALKDDEVVGWCDISPRWPEGLAHCGRLGIGVRRDLRRRGIGRRLIERTIDKARDKGLERIELEVRASNTPAIGLYGTVGFVVEGVKKRAWLIDDTYDDLVVMALLV